MKITGSQAVLESFKAENVDTIFGYPGGAIMPVYDALYDYRDSIRHILVRHEQGAAHAAEGYARMTGEPGVCLVTSGPGATNLITGITDAMIDSVPLICVTGQVHAQLLGTDAFQEASVIGMVTPVTKWCYQITHADEVAYVMKKAFHIARSGRPGPVLIDITKNAQFEECDFKYPKTITLPGKRLVTEPDQELLTQAAKVLNEASRPYLLIGHGILISGAEQALIKVAEKGNIPIASTLLGLSAVSEDHPLYMGMLGMHGNYGTNILTNEADVIFAVGMRFDDRVTSKVSEYAKQAKVIHVDIDPAELNKIIPANVAIQADAKAMLEQLLPLIEQNANKRERADWCKQFAKNMDIERELIIDEEVAPADGPITMAEVMKKLGEKTQGKAIIVADVGQHQMSAARYYGYDHEGEYITSGGLGTMGFALPASIGAKLARPKKEVIAIIGDGCFQMNLQELGTIAQEGLAVKIIILNNEHLGMVRQWQEMFFDARYSYVHMENPNFITLAKAYDIEGEIVDEREMLETSLTKLLDAEESYVLDIRVKKEEKVFPIVPSGAAISDIRLK